MNILRLYLINFTLLVITVPWFFIESDSNNIFGFPYWAFYSLFSTFIYAINVYYFLQKFWFLAESEK